MSFHRVRLRKEQLNIYFGGETIVRVNSTKFLGVIIDDKLKWTAHIQWWTVNGGQEKRAQEKRAQEKRAQEKRAQEKRAQEKN